VDLSLPGSNTFASVGYLPMLVTKHVVQNQDYPYSNYQPRREQEKALLAWLLGNDAATTPDYPLGGAALVTGFRGVGKSSLVDKVIFEAGLSLLYGLELNAEPPDDGTHWGPFKKAELSRLVQSKKHSQGKSGMPVLLVPIRIAVANPIEPKALMARLIRRTYLTLASYEIGDKLPGLMRTARLAYIRTLGELTMEVGSRFQESFGLTLEGLSKLDVTAAQEVEFSEQLKLVARGLSVEESEDELLDIADLLTSEPIGAMSPIARRVGGALHGQFSEALNAAKELFEGSKGQRVHLLFVFDELDKLQGATSEEQEDTKLNFSLTEELENGSEKKYSGKGSYAQASRRSRLEAAGDVIRQLKTLFSSVNVSAVVVGGHRIEEDWNDELRHSDPLLRSIFSRHVYVPQIDSRTVSKFLTARGTSLPPTPSSLSHNDLASGLAILSRGRYKELLRLTVELEVGGRVDVLPMNELSQVATLGDRLDPDPMGDPLTLVGSRGIDEARNLAELSGALVSTGVPLAFRSAFGRDLVLSLLLDALLEFWNPATRNDSLARDQRIDEVVSDNAHHLPESYLRIALLRLCRLIDQAQGVE